MIQELYNYFIACPLLEEAKVNIDYLAPENGSISIFSAPSGGIIKNYCGGGSLREYCFSISIRSAYKGSLADGLRNEQLCEELAEWTELQNANSNLPILDSGLTSQKLEVMSGGWLDDTSTNRAIYKINFRLIYTKL